MRKISVRVYPNKNQTRVEKTNHLPGLNRPGYKIYLTKPAQNNQANQELIQVMADHFQTKPNQVFLLKGQTQRNKLIGISN
jgi:uncharacterized protein YggU (UPF0235/DUF167 family)